MKKTKWFKALHQKPVREGWYEVKCKHKVYGPPSTPGERLYYRDSLWFFKEGGYDTASFGYGCDSWRGLTEQWI